MQLGSRMWLHQCHLATGAPKPLLYSCTADAWDARVGRPRPQWLQQLADQALVELKDFVSDRPNLLVTLGQAGADIWVDAEETLSIELASAMVARTMPSQSSSRSSVVVIATQNASTSDRSKADTDEPLEDADLDLWVIFVKGSETFMRNLMYEFGMRGALRTDLDDEFSLMTPGPSFSRGAFGCVREAVPRASTTTLQEARLYPSTLAAKYASLDGDEQRRQAAEEVRLLLRAQGHPNVVRCYGVFARPNVEDEEKALEGMARKASRRPYQVVLTDFCRRGDLHSRVQIMGKFRASDAHEVMTGVFSALAHLQDHQVVHGDVQAANILLSSHGTPVLTNFGLVACTEDGLPVTKSREVSAYAAPELLTPGQEYDQKIDVYGAGVVLYYLLTTTLPFSHDDDKVLAQQIKSEPVVFPRKSAPCAPMRTLIQSLLAKDPEDRPLASEAVELEQPAANGKLAARLRSLWSTPVSTNPSRSGSKSTAGDKYESERPSAGRTSKRRGDGSTVGAAQPVFESEPAPGVSGGPLTRNDTEDLNYASEMSPSGASANGFAQYRRAATCALERFRSSGSLRKVANDDFSSVAPCSSTGATTSPYSSTGATTSPYSSTRPTTSTRSSGSRTEGQASTGRSSGRRDGPLEGDLDGLQPALERAEEGNEATTSRSTGPRAEGQASTGRSSGRLDEGDDGQAASGRRWSIRLPGFIGLFKTRRGSQRKVQPE